MVFLLLGDLNSYLMQNSFIDRCRFYRFIPLYNISQGKFPEKQDVAPILLAPGSRKYSYAIEERTKKEKNREQPFWKCSVIRNKEAYFHKTVFVSLRLPCTENRKKRDEDKEVAYAHIENKCK